MTNVEMARMTRGITKLSTQKAVPAYQPIKNPLLNNIHSVKWQAGEAISTEMALAEEFGVSRMTVNRALKELSEERVLERRQGSGTFVALKVLTMKQALKNESNDDDKPVLYEVKIIHFADGQPIQFEECWVDAIKLPKFIEQDFSVVNTSDYLIAKIPLEHGSYTIRALAAPDEVDNALQIEVQSPTLVLSRQTYSSGKV